MSCHGVASLRCLGRPSRARPQRGSRYLNTSRRQRVTDLWSPRPKVEPDGSHPRNATNLLVDAGYIRQAYAGIFHLLPLGLRVLNKVERLIDKHMQSVGASKVSLSAISSQKLWDQSGRLANGSEMFKFEDRGKLKWLLAPTHEEEITTLLKTEIINDQHLPVRLYQVGRKYRDEQRPRGGLLRGREFIMKDLYTFDATPEDAEQTYQVIRQAYRNLFSELAVPFIEARADSGNMGGSLSHEFHFPNDSGEDTLLTCDICDHSRNEEFVTATHRTVKEIESSGETIQTGTALPVEVRDYISSNSSTLIRVIRPTDPATEHPYASTDLNTFAIKESVEDVTDVHTGVEEHQAVQMFEEHLRKYNKKDDEASQLVYLIDKRVTEEQVHARTQQDLKQFDGRNTRRFIVQSANNAEVPINLISARDGDSCPSCSEGKLQVHKAIEIGHTFHLGTRYSSKLGLNLLPKHKGGQRIPVEMGCHGIGVTRLLAASVSCLSDPGQEEIRWPRAIAPYDVIICTGSNKPEALEAAHQLYDVLTQSASAVPGVETLDVVLDDRTDRNYAKKLKEANFIGYSVIIMLGKSLEKGAAHVICPSSGVEEDRPLNEVPDMVHAILKELSSSPAEGLAELEAPIGSV